nr:E3 ubiquitin-protein ligase Os04g0590900-like [Ipomoea batatas]
MVPTVSDPKTWVPYMNTRDCSQGFCSLYCPQWCYIIFPPPPPFDFPEDNSSGPSFSPLVIAIIGILASAFLLVSYYAIMSKYCGNRRGRIRESDDNNQRDSDDSEENQDPSIHGQPWNSANTGLDEALIKSITVFKYKKGDGVVIDGSDCPVCLKTNNPPKSPERNHHTITIREDNLTRRSVSMDSSPCQGRLSIADILRIDHDEECSFHDSQMQEIGSSKAEIRQSVLGCVISPAVMHRSFSSGRFFFPKLNRPPTNTSTILPS